MYYYLSCENCIHSPVSQQLLASLYSCYSNHTWSCCPDRLEVHVALSWAMTLRSRWDQGRYPAGLGRHEGRCCLSGWRKPSAVPTTASEEVIPQHERSCNDTKKLLLLISPKYLWIEWTFFTEASLTVGTLNYNMLKYPLKCAPAGTINCYIMRQKSLSYLLGDEMFAILSSTSHSFHKPALFTSKLQ